VLPRQGGGAVAVDVGDGDERVLPQRLRPLLADQAAAHDAYAHFLPLPRSSGVIRRRVNTSLLASSSRQDGRPAQSSQTPLSSQPVMPSLSAEARNVARAAPFSRPAPPVSRCFSERS